MGAAGVSGRADRAAAGGNRLWTALSEPWICFGRRGWELRCKPTWIGTYLRYLSSYMILRAVAEKRREGERAMEGAGVGGGPLDRMAEGRFGLLRGKWSWESKLE